MTQKLAWVVSWGCQIILVLSPLIAAYLVIDIQAFASLAQQTLNLAIQWHGVTDVQWYTVWAATFAYFCVGLAGLYYLRKAFVNFARGELFNLANSRNLRLFSLFLLLQSLLKPLHIAILSLLLSWHHPPGQKVLSLILGSDEFTMLALAIIFWVLSDMLVKANALEEENKQFI
ncbi:DUF2975 domain-containing protein [Planctobacterium marinum]|uniref:DUF2975 domain-containing protein n=1 Tax=Planctobacterium marinum TaxID=1631968 RepID=UPI001E2AE024|nr:DUF2975 domain-containing protein [Planctobacterium marinum]MCC2604658.1 DUF2975 domain-containing protein [Planctobacterium marinum]